MRQINKRIVFITSTISQPRVLKRINSFKQNGFIVKVYAFDRGVYNVNELSEGISLTLLGKQKDGKEYFSKLLQFFKLHRILSKKYNQSNDLFYAFGFLEAFPILFFPKKYIYEISDILYGYKKFRFIEWLLKFIDKKLIKNSLLTVVTSGGFKDYFFPKKEFSNIIVQPNKLNSYFKYQERENIKFSCLNPQKIIFTYIGAFRYPNTVFRFAHVIGKSYPNHSFKFIGDSVYTPEVKAIASLYPNVKFYGQYKNPEDLSEIYDSVDFIVACYDPEGLNERIAEPNKLYEAMFFKKPIVVTKGTYLEKQVQSFGCGFAIDATTDQNIISFIESLSENYLKEIESNIEKVKTLDLIDDDAKHIIVKLLSL